MTPDEQVIVEGGRRYLLIKQHDELRDARGRLVGWKWTHMALIPLDEKKRPRPYGRESASVAAQEERNLSNEENCRR